MTTHGVRGSRRISPGNLEGGGEVSDSAVRRLVKSARSAQEVLKTGLTCNVVRLREIRT